MKQKKIPYTALGIVIGGAAGVRLAAVTGQTWWYGLVGVGLILGAGLDMYR